MGHSKPDHSGSMRAIQNELLYNGVKYSSFGSVAAAVVLTLTFWSEVNQNVLLMWMLMTCSVYFCRWLDSRAFARRKADQTGKDISHWHRRFNFGATIASIVWASSIWLLFPADHGYQVMLVLTLVGVAGGAIASLPYDHRIMCTFQLIIILAALSRLVVAADPFALKFALFNVFIFGFMMSCGKEVSRNYAQQLKLKQDSERHNLSMIKITEQVARIGYWHWDTHSEKIHLSDNLAKMWDVDELQISIADWMDLVHVDDIGRLKKVLASDHGDTGESAVEFRMVGGGQNLYRDMNQITKSVVDSDNHQFLLGTVQDISAIKSAEKKIYRMAFFDDLTGLSNRGNFHEQLKNQIVMAQRFEKNLALMYIDLDDFKEVNDSYGHEIGDNYLRIFADHIKATVRASDVTARLGGDEFCVVLTGVRNRDEVRLISDKLFEFCNRVLEIGNHRIQPKLSVGLSMYPHDGTDADELLKSADLAMYAVKQNGKHGYQFFEQRMLCETTDRVELEASLRQAIDNFQFELWYQPKVDMRVQRITGVEALIRWRHPEKGIVPPDVFISTAERVGMINEIGEWVLETACEQLRDWRAQGIDLQMAINISGGHFISEGFCQRVIDSVERNNLPPSSLEVEITESMTRDPEQHSRICHQMRDAGVRIAIDDFGTGYSSLSVLDKLEVDTLKIDKSFIEGLPHDNASILLVKAIMELSLGLGYDVVAEGVENHEQLEHLDSLGCPYIQGYLFSKPVQSQEIPQLIKQHFGPMDQAA